MFWHYVRGVRSSIRNNSTAYGYSVTITVVFGMVARREGAPDPPHLFLYAAGAAAAFTVVEALASRFFTVRIRGDPAEVVVLGSAFNLLSIATALGAGTAAATVFGGLWAWMAASFLASLAYILVVGVELTLARRAEANREQVPEDEDESDEAAADEGSHEDGPAEATGEEP